MMRKDGPQWEVLFAAEIELTYATSAFSPSPVLSRVDCKVVGTRESTDCRSFLCWRCLDNCQVVNHENARSGQALRKNSFARSLLTVQSVGGSPHLVP